MTTRRRLIALAVAGAALPATLVLRARADSTRSSDGVVRWSRPDRIEVVTDGNSIVEGGQDGRDSVLGVMGFLAENLDPFRSVDHRNWARGGQTIDGMIARGAGVDRMHTASRACILVVQEGTNQLGIGDSPHVACEKLLGYIAARRAARPWAAVAIATAPPAYLGDHRSAAASVEFNAKLDAFNDELRARWSEGADVLIETRSDAGPFSRERFPNYQRSTFFNATNDASLLTEPFTGPMPWCKIHPSASAIRAQAPIWSAALLSLDKSSAFGRTAPASIP